MDPITGKPADYTELFENYFPMMCKVVRAAGIMEANVEDVAMEILAKFIDKDGLAFYDADRLHDVGRAPVRAGPRFRPARFSSMLRGFVSTYVLDFRDRQERSQRREGISLDAPVPNTEDSPVPEGCEIYEDTTVDDVTIRMLLVRGREELAEHSVGLRDYDAFMGFVLEQGFYDGHLSRERLSRSMGCSMTTLGSMLREMRFVLRPLFVEAGLREAG